MNNSNDSDDDEDKDPLEFFTGGEKRFVVFNHEVKKTRNSFRAVFDIQVVFP